MGWPKAGGYAGPPLQFVVFQWEPDIIPGPGPGRRTP